MSLEVVRQLTDLEKRLERLETSGTGYQTGSWTPLLTGSGGGGNYTTSVAVGEYIRIGGAVHVWGRYTVNTFTSAPAGNLRMTGLPFTSRNVSNLFYAVAVGYTNSALSTVARGIIPANTAYVDFYDTAGATVAASLMSAASYVIIGGSYAV